MKSLTNYICESINPIMESNFHDEALKIEKLPPKLQDVEKFKLLVTKWDKLGEEVAIGRDEHYAGTNFEYIEKCFFDDDEHGPDKRKVIEAKDNFREAHKLDESDINGKVKIYGAYIDAMYSWAKKYATSGKGRNKYVDQRFIVTSFLGLGSWIINYGFARKELQDKLLGKLITKFNKDMSTLNGVRDVTKFMELYNEKCIDMKRAFDTETAIIKSINDLKEERTKHKYTIIASQSEGQVNILFFDNEKINSFEEIFETKEVKQCDCSWKWTGLNEESLLRKVISWGKTVPPARLSSDKYLFDKNDKSSFIPMFGFCDELPTDMYSFYDGKYSFSSNGGETIRKRGSLSHELREGKFYSYFDSLWHNWKD